MIEVILNSPQVTVVPMNRQTFIRSLGLTCLLEQSPAQDRLVSRRTYPY